MTNVQFDNKITLGNVLTVIAAAVAFVVGWADLNANQGQLERELSTTSAAVSSSDSRIRALEVTVASTTADLRNILAVLSRIERQLEARE